MSSSERWPLSISRLVRGGVLTEERARRALERAGAPEHPIRAVVADGAATEEAVATALATAARRPRAELAGVVPDPALVRRFSPETIEQRLVLPIRRRDERVVEAAIVDPLDYGTIKIAEFLLGSALELYVATPGELEAALSRIEAPALDPVEACEAAISQQNLREELANGLSSESGRGIENAPMVRLVDECLDEAIRFNASDIHIEPGPNELVVRHRIDGVLHERHRLRGVLRYPVVSRVKVMAGMDVAEHRKPQDGQFSIVRGAKRLMARVSTLPSIHGESVAIRLLDPQARHLELDEMGLAPDVRDALVRAVRAPQGIIISTGPTGSGKTSTQYGLLRLPLADGRKTITLENPVEYRLDGATQIDINDRADLTFASGLRSVLRQDPNVILVGEVRDLETAEIACRAALTGHLVLTTLHTNDAIGTVVRLLDLGIHPGTLASSLTVIVSQRLVRKLCPVCSESDQPDPERLERFGFKPDAGYRRAKGCDACAGTGYKGRTAVFEIVEVTPPVRALIASRASEEELRRALLRMGLKTLHMAAAQLARQGVTSLDEIARVLVRAHRASALCPNCAAEVYNDFPSCPQCLAPLQTVVAPTASMEPTNRVIVADDDESVLELVSEYVRSLGFEVLRATDGPEAIRLAREMRPAAIALDVFMPRLTGIQACQRLRADPLTAQIPVLLMTGDEGQELKLRAYDMGTDDYVRKPIDRADFLGRLKRIVDRRGKVDRLTRKLDPAKLDAVQALP